MSRAIPGDVLPCIWDGDNGTAVVIQSSSGVRRHIDDLSKEGAEKVLAWALIQDFGYDDEHLAQMRADALAYVRDKASETTWRTVLASECDDGYHEVGCGVDDCEQGSMCSEGAGKRFVTVLCVNYGPLHNRWYDEADAESSTGEKGSS